MANLLEIRFRLVPNSLPPETSDWATAGRSLTVLIEQDVGNGWRHWMDATFNTGQFAKDRSTDPPTLRMPSMAIGDGQALPFRQVRITATIADGAIRFGGEAEIV